MNKLISFVVLLFSVMPVYSIGGSGSNGGGSASVPEPGMLPLLGLGVISILLIQKFKSRS